MGTAFHSSMLLPLLLAGNNAYFMIQPTHIYMDILQQEDNSNKLLVALSEEGRIVISDQYGKDGRHLWFWDRLNKNTLKNRRFELSGKV